MPLSRLTYALLVFLAGCGGEGGDGGAGGSADALGGAPDAHVVPPDAGPARPDSAPPATDAAPDEADAGPRCAADPDCGEGAWCDELGACQPNAAQLFVDLPPDGVTRAAAAAFDIAPAYLERWFDRAGPECPDNVPARFDGRLDMATPDDPCADGFDDADGDGLFDGVWLAGAGSDRPALGIDNANPPAGRVLMLARDDQVWVLVTLDVYAVDVTRMRDLARYLKARLGVPDARVAVHATGNRSGPDSVGLWGPSLTVAAGPRAEVLRQRGRRALSLLGSVPLSPGVAEDWWETVRRRSEAALRQAGHRLEPVTVRAATVELPLEPPEPPTDELVVPDADADGVLNDERDLAAWRGQPWRLSRDLRAPLQRDRLLRAVAFQAAAGGQPVAILAGWGAAPATLPAALPTLSADFPGVVRRALEAETAGAVAVWLTSAADDTVVADEGAFIPAVDHKGRPIDADGRPVDDLAEAAPAPAPTEALGSLLAARVLAALAEAEPASARLEVTGRYAWVPMTNPRVGMAARLGLLRHLGDWLSGRVSTSSWSSSSVTPSCGGLGCLRYRLDRVDLGPVTLVTTPAALDDAYVQGRARSRMAFGDAPNLLDVDADGEPDATDAEIRVQARGLGREMAITLPGPVNPQRFDAVEGLARPQVWVVGRTNGGLGGMHPPGEHVNVFEGQLDALAEFAAIDANGMLDLCAAGYPCVGRLTLGELVASTGAAQSDLLADVPGAHELWLAGVEFPDRAVRGPWRVEAPDGTTRIAGEEIEVGPGNRAFTLDSDFRSAGVQSGDLLRLDGEPDGHAVGGIVPIVLSEHPNRGDAWQAGSGGGGDFVYNTACELLHGGACPSRRPVPPGEDPNQVLQRTP